MVEKPADPASRRQAEMQVTSPAKSELPIQAPDRSEVALSDPVLGDQVMYRSSDFHDNSADAVYLAVVTGSNPDGTLSLAVFPPGRPNFAVKAASRDHPQRRGWFEKEDVSA